MEFEDSDRVCHECGRPLLVGSDAVALQRCVVGPSGLVPVEDHLLYCDDTCLRGDKKADTIIRRPRRIP